MSQEEARAELRHCNKEISHYSEHLVAAKEILAATRTIWTTTGKNLYFLAAMQKHVVDTPESPETLTKRRKKEEAIFGGVTTKGDIGERDKRNTHFP